MFLDFLIHSVLQLLGLFEQLPLPQLNTLMLGMGSLFCLIMLVFFIDRYFMVLMKIDDRSNSQLNRQISISLMGVFLGLMAFLVVHELEIQSNYNRAETFTMNYYKNTFTVVKIDQKLIIDGEIRNAKTQEKICEKLKNYIQQMGIETIEWRYRGRDSP